MALGLQWGRRSYGWDLLPYLILYKIFYVRTMNSCCVRCICCLSTSEFRCLINERLLTKLRHSENGWDSEKAALMLKTWANTGDTNQKKRPCLWEYVSVYLWGVRFNRWAALCATVQGKVNERLSVWKGHLVDNMANDTSCYIRYPLTNCEVSEVLGCGETECWNTCSRGSVLEKGLRSCATPFLFPLRTPFSMSCNVNTSPPIR